MKNTSVHLVISMMVGAVVIYFLKKESLPETQTIPIENFERRIEIKPRTSSLVAEKNGATRDLAANPAFVPIEVIQSDAETIQNCTDCPGFLPPAIPNQNLDVESTAEKQIQAESKKEVESVLDQILLANNIGDSNAVAALKESLQALSGVGGAEAMFELLLGQGRYIDRPGLTEDLRSILRDAIRLVPDQKLVGNFAARLYMDAQSNGQNDALWELFYGVAHPNMLSQLAVKAYLDGSQQSAEQFLDRLSANADQGAVQAFVQIPDQEPELLKEAAKRIFAWSDQHKEQAQAGLFLEYLTDSTLSAAQRIVAAYGIAGVKDSQFAIQSLEKAVNLTGDPSTISSLEELRTFLSGRVEP